MIRNLLVAAVALLLAGNALAGSTAAQKCESEKNKEAGKYGSCRQKAEAKFALTGDAAARTLALTKCADKYAGKWPVIESKAGGTCPSAGDQTAIQQYLDSATTSLATALAGGTLPDCPADLLACEGDLGTCNGNLGTCSVDLTTCGGALTTCSTDLGTCSTNLAACQAAAQGSLLKTGQTACYNTSGTVIPCAGTGQDGELQKGLARAYTDNGDGTITETKTGLMWEKLSDDGSIHDKDNGYTWPLAFAGKIAMLNGGGGFAGHTDWRLPNRSELESLLNLGALAPAVSPAFNAGCIPGCTLLTCSCTQPNLYWSSSTSQASTTAAWYVFFFDGSVDAGSKGSSLYVRAVRGGS